MRKNFTINVAPKIKINDIKKEVIKQIESLKFTGRYSKNDLVFTFKNFKIEDFNCFAEDDNTYISPEEYYLLNNPILVFSKEKAKREIYLINTQQSFHTIDGERGVNLLKCCSKCRNCFIINIFKETILKKLLKEDE